MLKVKALLAALLLSLAACSPVYHNHGYIPPDEDLAQVEPGRTTRDELGTLIGRPSAQGLLAGSGWYYVGSRWEHYGARKPREISREVIAVSFTDAGVVSNVERFGLEQGRVVTLSRRVTDGGVSSVSVVRQILGNFGRFTPGQVLGGSSPGN